MVECSPKQEKLVATHVVKKQKLELKRPYSRHPPEVIAKLEVEQYMMEETLEGIQFAMLSYDLISQ